MYVPQMPGFWDRTVILNRLLVLLSMIGFSLQVINISVQFFTFTTITHVRVSTPEKIAPYAVAICFRFSDILQTDRMFNETGIKLAHVETIDDAIRDEGRLTIKQVFEYTPKAEDAIASCYYRPDPWVVVGAKAKECREQFEVSKFQTQEFMCYKIWEREHRDLRMDVATRSTFGKNEIFSVYFNVSFKDADVINPIIMNNRDLDEEDDLPKLPYRSRDHSPVLKIRDPLNPSGSNNFFQVIPSSFESTALEAPYDTQCINRQVGEIADCRLKCQLQKMRPFKLVPGYELLQEEYDLKPVATRDIQNDLRGPQIREAVNYCTKKCTFKPCSGSFTASRARVRSVNDPSIGFALVTPVAPVIRVTARPSMSFVDFFSFVSSCFGTWFGISFLSIGSWKFFKQKEDRRPYASSLSTGMRRRTIPRFPILHPSFHHHYMAVTRPPKPLVY